MDKVGKMEIGLKFDLSFFRPLLLKMGETCAIFHKPGKCPTSKKVIHKFREIIRNWLRNHVEKVSR